MIRRTAPPDLDRAIAPAAAAKGAARRSSWRFAAALAASLAVHAVGVPLLVAPSHGPPRAAPASEATLFAILLSPAPTPAPAAVEPAAQPAAAIEPPTVAPREPPRPSSPVVTPPGRDAVMEMPVAVVRTDVPFARLNDTLNGRIMTEFPIEVSTQVQLPESLVVRYPRVVGDEPLERQVILWIVVDANGKPEEMHLVQGSGTLAQAAIDAFGTARYTPATNFGERVRHHIAVEVDFPQAVATQPDGRAHPSAAATP